MHHDSRLRRALLTLGAAAAALPLALVPATPAGGSVGPYDYPIDPGTPQWEAFTTHAQMVEATQVPQAVLDAMSTEDLVTTIMTYPLLLDRVAFNTPQQGFEVMSGRFNGFAELAERPDAGAALLARYDALTDAALAAPSAPESLDSDIESLEAILAQPAVLSAMSEADVDTTIVVATEWLEGARSDTYLSTPTGEESTLLLAGRAVAVATGTPWLGNDFLSTGQAVGAEAVLDVEASVYAYLLVPMPAEVARTERDYSGTVTTPKGSAVPVIVTTYELSSAKITEYNRYVATRYPRAVRETNASRRYNCHSYAWYSQSTSNTRWMNSPGDDRYWTDGSYLRWHPPLVWKSTMRMSYVGDHSSKWFSHGWRSKWGQLPRMKHAWDYSPYDDSTVTSYYRAGT